MQKKAGQESFSEELALERLRCLQGELFTALGSSRGKSLWMTAELLQVRFKKNIVAQNAFFIFLTKYRDIIYEQSSIHDAS